MPSLEALPPDQRAVVQLVLQQGRSYEEIAALLGIPVAAVRDRARSGVAALGDASAPGEREAVVSDWLLGQAAVPTTLEDDADAQAFAKRAAAGLAAVPGARVPDVPRATSAPDAGDGATPAAWDAPAGANGDGMADGPAPGAVATGG